LSVSRVGFESFISHQIVDDDVRSPEVIDHVAANVDLSGRPVGRAVQDHSRLRPHQLVGPANADLLETIRTNIFVNELLHRDIVGEEKIFVCLDLKVVLSFSTKENANSTKQCFSPLYNAI
jgi:hypothetical protein